MDSRLDLQHSFKLKIWDSIQNELQFTRTLTVARGECVYVSGQRDASVYCIESGQVKLVFFTPEGRECVLAIRTAGDIFGELCLTGQVARVQTAVVMKDSRLRAIPYLTLLKTLKDESLLEDLVQYLAGRIAEQQEFIGLLLSANSEQRLANMFLRLGTLFGTIDSQGKVTIPRILFEDLAAMVGTTRSRVVSSLSSSMSMD
jgi:CRP/FNR family cyclic AMP-dependent transcriptional regulator